MPTYHQPKNLSFIPPVLRRKFIVPDNPRELASLVIIIGLAVTLITGLPQLNDALAAVQQRTAPARLVASVPFRANIEQRMVGVYVFADETGADASVRGDRIYYDKAKVPKSVLVAWKPGRVQTAQPVWDYLDYALGLPFGLALIAGGFWLRMRKRVDRLGGDQ